VPERARFKVLSSGFGVRLCSIQCSDDWEEDEKYNNVFFRVVTSKFDIYFEQGKKLLCRDIEEVLSDWATQECTRAAREDV